MTPPDPMPPVGPKTGPLPNVGTPLGHALQREGGTLPLSPDKYIAQAPPPTIVADPNKATKPEIGIPNLIPIVNKETGELVYIPRERFEKLSPAMIRRLQGLASPEVPVGAPAIQIVIPNQELADAAALVETTPQGEFNTKIGTQPADIFKFLRSPDLTFDFLLHDIPDFIVNTVPNWFTSSDANAKNIEIPHLQGAARDNVKLIGGGLLFAGAWQRVIHNYLKKPLVPGRGPWMPTGFAYGLGYLGIVVGLRVLTDYLRASERGEEFNLSQVNTDLLYSAALVWGYATSWIWPWTTKVQYPISGPFMKAVSLIDFPWNWVRNWNNVMRAEYITGVGGKLVVPTSHNVRGLIGGSKQGHITFTVDAEHLAKSELRAAVDRLPGRARIEFPTNATDLVRLKPMLESLCAASSGAGSEAEITLEVQEGRRATGHSVRTPDGRMIRGEQIMPDQRSTATSARTETTIVRGAEVYSNGSWVQLQGDLKGFQEPQIVRKGGTILETHTYDVEAMLKPRNLRRWNASLATMRLKISGAARHVVGRVADGIGQRTIFAGNNITVGSSVLSVGARVVGRVVGETAGRVPGASADWAATKAHTRSIFAPTRIAVTISGEAIVDAGVGTRAAILTEVPEAQQEAFLDDVAAIARQRRWYARLAKAPTVALSGPVADFLVSHPNEPFFVRIDADRLGTYIKDGGSELTALRALRGDGQLIAHRAGGGEPLPIAGLDSLDTLRRNGIRHVDLVVDADRLAAGAKNTEGPLAQMAKGQRRLIRFNHWRIWGPLRGAQVGPRFADVKIGLGNTFGEAAGYWKGKPIENLAAKVSPGSTQSLAEFNQAREVSTPVESSWIQRKGTSLRDFPVRTGRAVMMFGRTMRQTFNFTGRVRSMFGVSASGGTVSLPIIAATKFLQGFRNPKVLLLAGSRGYYTSIPNNALTPVSIATIGADRFTNLHYFLPSVTFLRALDVAFEQAEADTRLFYQKARSLAFEDRQEMRRELISGPLHADGQRSGGLLDLERDAESSERAAMLLVRIANKIHTGYTRKADGDYPGDAKLLLKIFEGGQSADEDPYFRPAFLEGLMADKALFAAVQADPEVGPVLNQHIAVYQAQLAAGKQLAIE